MCTLSESQRLSRWYQSESIHSSQSGLSDHLTSKFLQSFCAKALFPLPKPAFFRWNSILRHLWPLSHNTDDESQGFVNPASLFLDIVMAFEVDDCYLYARSSIRSLRKQPNLALWQVVVSRMLMRKDCVEALTTDLMAGIKAVTAEILGNGSKTRGLG